MKVISPPPRSGLRGERVRERGKKETTLSDRSLLSIVKSSHPLTWINQNACFATLAIHTQMHPRATEPKSSTVKKRSPTNSRCAPPTILAPAALLFLHLATPGFAEKPTPQDVAFQVSGVDAEATGVQPNTVHIAAHRGGYEKDKSDNAPENSVANIRNCQSKGFGLYETDIQRTKDGRFVIMHDATIDRETTGTGAVCDLDLSDLNKLNKRFRDRTVSEHRVATLDEFLVEGKGRVVFKADLKPGVNQYFKEIMAIVNRHDATVGIIFRVPYRDANLYAEYRADGMPYTRDLLMFMVSSTKQVDDIQKRFDPSRIQVNVNKNDPTNPETLKLIRYATDQGMLVEAHAEGTEQDWQELIRAGVRMFHTNKPTKMKAFLRKVDSRNQSEN
ncbi:cytoplasmic glycerophosphodiester phosphodiesterase [Rubripirellula lacrimiformis]|uniref:Cytoplasmic glycerophosphodiester phosphodiesterase n=1 Tax=Rubripirellula lacrimiformis TaxID=1930273 RepID=A0A517ND85_9BACT|nr:glycerophosphodiester phosphodiesterase family protein [Rubripirellula lacrimiformis]QDT05081.1 cytoplasmic glycerophosphodiester phosphodiesterase [Rubripirellula lacrimiformis]